MLRACSLYVHALHLSIKAWCRRKMGSLADPCTEDMDPFMKTCKELCIKLWPVTASPVSGSANPEEKVRCLQCLEPEVLNKCTSVFLTPNVPLLYLPECSWSSCWHFCPSDPSRSLLGSALTPRLRRWAAAGHALGRGFPDYAVTGPLETRHTEPHAGCSLRVENRSPAQVQTQQTVQYNTTKLIEQ